MPKNSTVVLQSPEGELREVPIDQVQAALQQDWKKAPQKLIDAADNKATYGEGIENSVKAFLTSAADTATLGGYTAAATGLGLIDPEATRLREELNPASALAGEVAGIVGSMALPGVTPLGLAAKGAGAVERGVAAALPEATSMAGKVLSSGVSKFAGSAIEGAAFGAGQMVHESALGNPDITAQSAMAHIGLSALLGGALGSAMGLTGAAVSKAMEGVGSKYTKMADKLAKRMPEETPTKPSEFVAPTYIDAENTLMTPKPAYADPFEAGVQRYAPTEEIVEKVAEKATAKDVLRMMLRTQGKEATDSMVESVMKDASKVASRKATDFAIGAATGFLGIPAPVAIAGKFILDHIKNPTEIANRLIGYDSLVRSTGKAIETGVKKVFDSSPIVAGALANKFSLLNQKEYTKVTNEINQLSANPEELVNRLQKSVSDIYDYAPVNSQLLQQGQLKALEFLKSKIPLAPTKGPLDKPWTPSKFDINKFSKYYQSVENPVSILKHVRAGTVSKEQVEAVSTVYPALYKAMALELMNQIAERGNKIPYKTRLAITTFLNQPMERSMEGTSIAHNQAALTQVSTPPTPGGTPKKVNSSTDIDVASRYQTPFQRANSRDA